MRYQNVYVAGVASWLPPALTTAEALDDGYCPPDVAEDSGIESVTIAVDAAPRLATRAAQKALSRAGNPQIQLLLHATSTYQGHVRWTAAGFVQRLAVGTHNPITTLNVDGLGNGAMSSLELAAGFMAGGAAQGALLTAADRHGEPAYDRWRSDPGTPLGDGGGAMVLSSTGGWARVLGTMTWSEAELEGMSRGDDPFLAAPTRPHPVDLDTRQRAFIARLGAPNVERLVTKARRSALQGVLAEAGLTTLDIDWFVLPGLGRRRLEEGYYKALGIDPERTTWRWSRLTGSLGAADQFAGLDALATSGRLRPGDKCLLMGEGGTSWTCALIEVISPYAGEA